MVTSYCPQSTVPYFSQVKFNKTKEIYVWIWRLGFKPWLSQLAGRPWVSYLSFLNFVTASNTSADVTSAETMHWSSAGSEQAVRCTCKGLNRCLLPVLSLPIPWPEPTKQGSQTMRCRMGGPGMRNKKGKSKPVT